MCIFLVFCLFDILLSVLHFTASNCLFGIVKLFLYSQYIINIIVLILPITTDFMNQFSTAFSIFIRFPLWALHIFWKNKDKSWFL